MGCGKSSLAGNVQDPSTGSHPTSTGGAGAHPPKSTGGAAKKAVVAGGSKNDKENSKNKEEEKDCKSKEKDNKKDKKIENQTATAPVAIADDDADSLPMIVGPNTKLTILVLGGPGSGKASLCARMAEEYEFLHIGIGDLLRAEVKKNSSIGKQVSEPMKEGKLVPKDIPLNLLKANMKTKPHVIVDGYPKTLQQATTFEKDVCHVDMVVYLECPSDKMEERLLHRAQSSERVDDKSETIQKRLDTFNSEYLPVVSHFEALHPRRFRKIKAGSLQKVEVFLEVASHLKEMFGLEAKSVLVHKKHDCTQIVYIFILGGPGSGKGTQCKQMVRDFGYTHISTGDLLRNEVKSGTSLGKEVEQIMKEGKLVPLTITTTLLDIAIRSSGCKHFLIDGFPRSLEQAHDFEEKIGKPALVLYLSCSMSTMEKRLLERGKTSKRGDDNIETIKKRFESFQKESKPTVDYYKSSKKLKEISAEKDVDHVYKLVKEALLDTIEKYQKQ